MELRQLQYFIAVAAELHFARAAERLGITQPPLSRCIRALESELGVVLFSRSNKWRVSLTDAGRTFLPEAEKLLRQSEYAANLARAAGDGSSGQLRIGCISSMLGQGRFAAALLAMRRRFPGVTLEIVDSTSAGLPAKIRSRSMDLALLRSSPELFLDEELHCENLCADELVAVLPRQHRLAGIGDFPVRLLADESFIMVSERTSAAFRHFFFEFCRRYGRFTPRVVGEINNSYAALRLTAAGLGITIVSSAYCGMFKEELCFRRFTGAVPQLPITAVWSAERETPALANFLHILREEFREPNGPGG